MLKLPSESELQDETVDDLARRLYPGRTYDTAFPQGWLDAMLSRGMDPRGRFVWLYNMPGWTGIPAPLTAEAARDLAILATTLR